MMDPKDVGEGQHEFYRYVAQAHDRPRYTLHYRTDAPLSISSIFYVPDAVAPHLPWPSPQLEPSLSGTRAWSPFLSAECAASPGPVRGKQSPGHPLKQVPAGLCRLQSWSGVGSADGDPLARAPLPIQCEGPWATLRQARGAGFQKLQTWKLEFSYFSHVIRCSFFAFSTIKKWKNGSKLRIEQLIWPVGSSC